MTAVRRRTCKIISLVLAVATILTFLGAYLFYLDLKKTFLSRVSEKAGTLIGQRVVINDISFTPLSSIGLEGIEIRNPEGFMAGRLLQIKRITIGFDYKELLDGNIHLAKVDLLAPELTIMKDPEGRLNISEGLKQFLSKKGTLTYQVDEFRIRSGRADFNNDDRLRNENITVILKNLSSSAGVKTSIEGDSLWSGKNKIHFHGWANLKDDPKKFSIAVSTEDFSLSPLITFLEKHHIDAEKTKLTMTLEAKGDTDKGINLVSRTVITTRGYSFYRKDLLTIHMDASVFYDIAAHAAAINTLSVRSGDESMIEIKGRIIDLNEIPTYDLALKLDSLDLSAFNIARGYRINGILTSDSLNIKGRFDQAVPELKGSIQIREGSFTSDTARIEKVNGSMRFSSAGHFNARGEVSAEIVNAGQYSLSRPAAVRLSLNAEGRKQNLAFSAVMNTSPIVMKIGNEKELSLGDLHVSMDGMFRDNTFSGSGGAKTEGIRYADYAFKRLECGLKFNYRQDHIELNNLKIESDIFSLSADSFKTVMTEKKGGILIEAKNLSAVYPIKKAALMGVDLSATLNTPGKNFSGDMNFSAAGAIFHEIKSGRIAGRTTFNEREFSLAIPQAEFAGGKIRVVAQGSTFGQLFPVKAELTAENIDLGVLSLAAEKYSDTGYLISGDLKSASFKGTINSKVSLLGEAAIDLQQVSVANKKTKKRILKDASVQSAITFQDRDFSFKAGASSGSLAATASGTVNGFLGEGRSCQIHGHLKETPATDLRNSFWDVFPDSLLYAGLDGTMSSDINVDCANNRFAIAGELRLKAFTLEGENSEYSVGPVNGTIPFTYGNVDAVKRTLTLPAFESSEFDRIRRYYADTYPGEDYNRVTIGSLQYGYKLLKDITLWMKQDGGILNVARFSAKMFGGRLDGSAVADMGDGFSYRIGMLLEGLSLTKLCDDIAPIKGYISGKVNGLAIVKGSGTDLSEISGRADLWTYATKDEKTRISREFLQKIGGPSIKSYLGDRNFDKGVMSAYLQNGFLIFRELEISNRNFLGIQDLSVKVAPLSNRIAIDHLMWTIVEAASRGVKK